MMEQDGYLVCQSTDLGGLTSWANQMAKRGFSPVGGIGVEPQRNGDTPAKFYQVMFKAPPIKLRERLRNA